ncbi:hypothetical protein J2848_004852 [Azospirillum lipoferum]|uniref:DUF1513 domain-containing protein n=1 Tax=Azospirillum lipoferum TaxID=193 RepID=A0A5A9GJ70_AZOLI|nr:MULTISPECIES: DUF1513 domain-containing protein [Azospirillum]KAA0594416.1 DUF1513 domain-containing protein [Azospirillum lipoferum]MCP1613156.1 hypothetical protein [Azospirillum lipoferum]MDW5531356.1 DUF1513 domain-containing protein [Azospirillum sp. NL1]
MAVDRRNILGVLAGRVFGGRLVASLSGGGLLAVLTGKAQAADADTLYLNAYATAGAEPSFGVAALDRTGKVLFTTATPGRAHGIVSRPGMAEAAVFARRPGRWFQTLSLADGTPGPVVRAPDDRRFTGHGDYSADGRTLYVAEDDVLREEGAIGVYDATDNYRRIGAIPTHGLGPHELILMRDGTTLAVANGGVITHPDTGRAKLNLDSMDSSLTYVEAATGKLLDKVRLPEEHANLGMRHIALLDDGGIAFGVQDERPIGMLQPLAGAHRPGSGAVRLFDTPEDVLSRMQGYVGSVASDGKTVAASSPMGGIIGLWSATDGAWLGSTALADGCGLAPSGEGYLATSGLGVIEPVSVSAEAGPERKAPAFRWDNHLTRRVA